MTAVGPEYVVIDIEQERLADRGRLLTDGKVRGTTVVIGDTLVFALCLDLLQHGLKSADDGHISVDADQILARKAVQLVGHRALVLIDRDRVKLQMPRLADVCGANH